MSDWLKRNGMSVWHLSTELRHDTRTTQDIVDGVKMPTLVTAYRIERITRGEVPAAYWLGTPCGKWAWEHGGKSWKVQMRGQVAYEKRDRKKNPEKWRERDRIKDARRGRKWATKKADVDG